MKKVYINKLIELGFLDNLNCLSIYGQEIVDKFVELLLIRLKKEGFKHYNLDFINSNIKGKYYRINNNVIEIMTNEGNINNDALDLQYLFSKALKDDVGLSLIEGYKVFNNYNYYYGYLIYKGLNKIYEIKQNKKKAYLRFDLINIFYSILDEKDYLSYLLAPYYTIIPLHQNKSGVLSYAKKVSESLSYNFYIDDRNISPLEKKKTSNQKRVPLVLYLGPKEYKNQLLIVEFENVKREIDKDEIDSFLEMTLKHKLCNYLKTNYFIDKEVSSLNSLNKISKVNLCEDCLKTQKFFMYPFNRINKNKHCLLCNKEVNNMVYIKK